MERQVYMKNVENVQSFRLQVLYGCAIDIYATEVPFLLQTKPNGHASLLRTSKE